MKKKIYVAVLGIALACTMVGCGKKGGNDVKDDIVEFVNEELPAITSDRDSAISTYNAYFTSANQDKDAFIAQLEGSAIPAMNTYLENLDKIEVKTDEAKELKELLVMSATKQRDAMNMVLNALKEENPEYLTQADDMIADSKDYMNQFEEKLAKLAADNDITLNGLDTVATSTDAN